MTDITFTKNGGVIIAGTGFGQYPPMGSVLPAGDNGTVLSSDGQSLSFKSLSSLQQTKQVFPLTSNTTLSSNYNCGYITNTGATTDITLTLDSATVGKSYTFAVIASFNVTVQATGSAVIRNVSNITSVNGTISSKTVGCILTLTCLSTNIWSVENISGAWTIN